MLANRVLKVGTVAVRGAVSGFGAPLMLRCPFVVSAIRREERDKIHGSGLRNLGQVGGNFQLQVR